MSAMQTQYQPFYNCIKRLAKRGAAADAGLESHRVQRPVGALGVAASAAALDLVAGFAARTCAKAVSGGGFVAGVRR